MNTKDNSYKPEYAVNNASRIKKIGLRLAVTEQNFQDEVKSAFALAKSAGQELDLTFCSGTPRGNRSHASRL
jgi:hypothetical protein